MFDVSVKIKTIKSEFRYSRMDQAKFVEFKCAMTFKKFGGLKLFKGCLPQILFGPFWNTLSK